MKKIIALAFTAVLTSGVHAQSNKEDVDMIQELFGESKKEMVTEYMKFNDTTKAAFWPVYDAFENERKVLGRQRHAIVTEYAQHYDTLNNAKSAELGQRALDNNVALETLNQKYFPKFTKAIGGRLAAKYMQLELYLQTVVRSELQDKVPLIDELDKSKKKK